MKSLWNEQEAAPIKSDPLALRVYTSRLLGREPALLLHGGRVIYVPYVMPGFALARRVFELTRDLDWKNFDGMVLEHHGIFSFADDDQQSYERMIALVSRAEEFLASRGALELVTTSEPF